MAKFLVGSRILSVILILHVPLDVRNPQNDSKIGKH